MIDDLALQKSRGAHYPLKNPEGHNSINEATRPRKHYQRMEQWMDVAAVHVMLFSQPVARIRWKGFAQQTRLHRIQELDSVSHIHTTYQIGLTPVPFRAEGERLFLAWLP